MAKTYKVLSIDGGGVRGIIPARWLFHLEQKLGKPLYKEFDMICGTSTGAILGGLIASGRPAKELIGLYTEHGDQIFESGARWFFKRIGRAFRSGISAPKYSDKGLENALKKELGDLRLGELKANLVVPAYDVTNTKAVFFKSHKKDHENYRLRDVIKASSSAPIYFPAHEMKVRGERVSLVDGSIVVNNPALCGVAELVAMHIPLECIEVFSLGTGDAVYPVSRRFARNAGAAQWALPLVAMLFDGNVESVSHIGRVLLPGRFHRANVRLPKALRALDNARNIGRLDHIARQAWKHKGIERILTSK